MNPAAAKRPSSREGERTIRSNRRRATMVGALPCGFVGVVAGVVVGVLLSALAGLVVALVVSVLGSVWLVRTASATALRSLGAAASSEAERPRLHNLVSGLCAVMGLPAPAILVVDSAHPNAMSVGRDPRSASIIVTSALEHELSLVELEGVLAHELVHIKRYDTGLAGVTLTVALALARVIGTETAAGLVHRLVGPGREFSADQRAATIVRYPGGLASALATMTALGAESPCWAAGVNPRSGVTRWLWIDPGGGTGATWPEGELDDTNVRAAALALL